MSGVKRYSQMDFKLVQLSEARLGLLCLPSQEFLNVFCALFLIFHQTCAFGKSPWPSSAV